MNGSASVNSWQSGVSKVTLKLREYGIISTGIPGLFH